MYRTFSRSLAALCVVLVAACSGVFALPAHADPNPPTLQSIGGAWPITRQWTPAETKHYAVWMEYLYRGKVDGNADQRMAKLGPMLRDPAMNRLLDPAFLGEGGNPDLPDHVIRSVHGVLDCAKLTAFFPAYYAYRRGLPWAFSSISSGGGDVRMSPYNVPTGIATTRDFDSPDAFFAALMRFNSGNYRVAINGRNAELSDTVPVAIDPEYLMPGCPFYIDGHCLTLARVTDYGEPYFFHASTTDNRDIYTYNGMNVVYGIPAKGDGPDPWAGVFQGFRVFRYPIAETDGNGRVTGIRRRTDAEMRAFGFSTEQYERMGELRAGNPISAGGLKPAKLQDLIRLRLRRVDRIDPLKFMDRYIQELLQVYVLREEFVQDAWADVKRNGPITFPEEQTNSNIFQAHGRWETWSSPSSDVDRRNKYHYLTEWLDYALRWYEISPAFLDLNALRQRHTINNQADLLNALIAEKRRIFDAAAFHYTNSKGDRVPLTLTDVEDRLYDLSFDPNHPPELRWGAPIGSEERATAIDQCTPVPDGACVPMEEAYALQAYYRAIGQRSVDSTRLRGMFTEGIPRRDKLEAYLAYIHNGGRANFSVGRPAEGAQPPKTTRRQMLGQPTRTMLPVRR